MKIKEFRCLVAEKSTDIVSVGDIVDCYVIDINKEKEKVSLSLIES